MLQELIRNKSAKFYASFAGKLSLFVLGFIFILFTLANLQAYTISCSFSTAAGCDNFTLLLLENDTGGYYNAHAQNTSVGTYGNALCCNSDAGLINSCTQSVVLKLENMTNSHVQVGNFSGDVNYTVPVCLAASARDVSCVYSKNSCAPAYSCIGSLASSEVVDANLTNAHFGPCEEYNLKVCCKINNPPTVNLTSPSDGDSTTNRTPIFNWTGNDEDGDTITSYQINLTAFLAPGGTSTCSDAFIDTTANEYYIPESDLLCLRDNGMYYVWSVRASDGTGYGSWSDSRIINITSLLAVSLPVNGIEFGSMTILQENDTTDNIPAPFRVQNDGNSLLHINLSSSGIWQSVAASNQYFQFKVDNVTGEEGAFNWSGSQTSFTNISVSGSLAIHRLNYSNSRDIAETDLYVQVPPNEQPAFRNTTITFLALLGED